MNNSCHFIDKELLVEKYSKELKPMHVVADELGVSVGSVYNYIHRYGIEIHRIIPPKSEIEKANTSKRLKGRKFSEETKRKMSESKKCRGVGHSKRRRDGYIQIFYPSNPSASADGYVMEHRLIMENEIGRPLRDDEVVHHINHKKDDNRIENLKLLTFKEHASLHMKERWQKKKGGMTYQ